jgi:CheY-like chemotaxis protein
MLSEFKEPEQFLKNKIILVAEDEEFNYRFLQKLISMRGGSSIWAKNGEEAIAHVRNREHIDLILMDVKMPVMNGYEATTAIKKIKPDIPIIAQTAFALYGDDEKSLEAGCDDYISKPILHEDLIKKLKSYL